VNSKGKSEKIRMADLLGETGIELGVLGLPLLLSLEGEPVLLLLPVRIIDVLARHKLFLPLSLPGVNPGLLRVESVTVLLVELGLGSLLLLFLVHQREKKEKG